MDTLSVHVLPAEPGDTIDVVIALANGTACGGLAFGLELPVPPVSILGVETDPRSTGAQTYHHEDGGSLRVVVLDPEGSLAFYEAAGNVVRVQVAVDRDAKPGIYPVSLIWSELVTPGPMPVQRQVVWMGDSLTVTDVVASLEQVEAFAGDTVSVALDIACSTPALALQAEVWWPEGDVVFVASRPVPGDLSSGVYAAPAGQSGVRLVVADLSGSASLASPDGLSVMLDLYLPRNLPEGDVRLLLDSVLISNASGIRIPVVTRDGRIQVRLRPNRPPTMVLPDTLDLIEDQSFEWAVPGSDPDGDELGYSFDGVPAWASADVTSGVLRGRPTDDNVGVWRVTIRVDDEQAGVDGILVLCVKNLSPTIAGSPPGNARVGATYRYRPTIGNLDGGHVSVETRASGVSVDSATGEFRWRPDIAGRFAMTLTARDTRGGAVSQGFQVEVAERPSVVIEEILADPPRGIEGDANRDGVRDGKEDEFVEIWNRGGASVDIGGWTLSDDDVSPARRFRFPDGTALAPNSRAVLFGGGGPPDLGVLTFPDDGSIGNGLTNSGDVVRLIDPVSADTVAEAVYGKEGGSGQSLIRDDTGSYGPHNLFPGKDLFSPGRAHPVADSVVVETARILTVGQSSSILLTARYADGTEREVGDLAQWDCDPNLVRLPGDGSAVPLRPGSTRLTARLGDYSAAVDLHVVAAPAAVPRISGDPAARARLYQAYEYLPSIANVGPDEVSLVTNASGVAFDTGTGAIRWEPRTEGLYDFQLTAVSRGGRDVQVFQVRVAGRPSIAIVEILADPPSGPAGDANGDGRRESLADEFVEILNLGTSPVWLGGLTIGDDDVSARSYFQFPDGAVLGVGERAILFGGGVPAGVPAHVYVDDGSIGNGLTNSGDTVLLLGPEHADTISQASYRVDGNTDESLVNDQGRWVSHSTAFGWGPFSPGTDGREAPGASSGDSQGPFDRGQGVVVEIENPTRPRPTGVVITEVLPGPAAGQAGDVNGDGRRSSYEDEFVEIRNTGPDTAHMDGWRLGDGETRTTRLFQFPEGTTLAPGAFATLFGGGTPEKIPGTVFTDDGRIGNGLSNSGEEVVLVSDDGTDTLAAASYTDSEDGVSLAFVAGRRPEFHNSLPGKDPNSPGRARAVLTRIALQPEVFPLSVGDTATVSVVGVFSDGGSQDLSGRLAVTSSDTSIAFVDELAVLHAVSEGEAEILAGWDDLRSGNSTVTVVRIVPAKEPERPNTAPLWVSAPDTAALVGLGYLYRPRVTDAEGDSVWITLDRGPAWARLRGEALRGWPERTDVGTAHVVLRATDGDLSAEHRFSINTLDLRAAVEATDDTLVYSGLLWRLSLSIPAGFDVQVDGGPQFDRETSQITWRPGSSVTDRRRISLAVSGKESDEIVAGIWVRLLSKPCVRISEILVNPTVDANGDSALSQFGDQFVELENQGSTEARLDGWRLYAGDAATRFPTATRVPPGGVLVLFGESLPAELEGGNVVGAGGKIGQGLADAGRLTLVSPSGADTIDDASYSDAPTGISLVRTSDSGEGWLAHTAVNGMSVSPGRAQMRIEPGDSESVEPAIQDTVSDGPPGDPPWGDGSLSAQPSPFNSATRITLQAPGGPASLTVYTVLGQVVRRLRFLGSGSGPREVTWDGRDERGRPAGSGVYLLRARSGGQTHTARVLLIR